MRELDYCRKCGRIGFVEGKIDEERAARAFLEIIEPLVEAKRLKAAHDYAAIAMTKTHASD